MKRKLTMLSLLLACVMCLTACNGNNNGTNDNNGTNGNNGGTASQSGGHYENNGVIGENTGKDVTAGGTNNSTDNTGTVGGTNGGNGSDIGGDNGINNGENIGGNPAGAGNAPALNTNVEKEGMAAAALRTTKVCWGLGKEKDSDNRPVDAVKAQEQYGKLGGVFVDTSGDKNIYLTFDEGYENGYTSKILDVLKEAGVKATFFVTYDYCRTSPDLVQRMIDEGHTVGNHSYTHPSMPDCSAKEMEEEVTVLHDYVKENFGYEMKLFRFPKGEFSEKALSIVKELGYTSVFWSFAYADWDTDSQPSAAEAFDKITSATHKGAVYLLHAVSKANADCLADVLDYWKNNGFVIDDLNRLI